MLVVGGALFLVRASIDSRMPSASASASINSLLSGSSDRHLLLRCFDLLVHIQAGGAAALLCLVPGQGSVSLCAISITLWSLVRHSRVGSIVPHPYKQNKVLTVLSLLTVLSIV